MQIKIFSSDSLFYFIDTRHVILLFSCQSDVKRYVAYLANFTQRIDLDQMRIQ